MTPLNLASCVHVRLGGIKLSANGVLVIVSPDNI